MTDSNKRQQEPVRVGIIGAGYMGGEYAKVISQHSGFKLVSVLSRSKERAIDFCRTFKLDKPAETLDQMYTLFQCQVIIVAVPELETGKVCEKLKDYPILVLVEKPLGVDMVESNKLISNLRGSTAKYFVALNRRFYDSTITAQQYFPLNGCFRHISIRDQQDTIQARLSGQPETVVKNWMYANSIHLIDYFNLFTCGNILDMHKRVKRSGKSLFVTVEIEFEDGNTASYFCAWNAPGGWSVNVRDSINEVDLTPLETISVRRFPERVLTKFDGNRSEFKPGLLNMVNEILIEISDQKSKLVSIPESHKLMGLIHSIYRDIDVPA